MARERVGGGRWTRSWPFLEKVSKERTFSQITAPRINAPSNDVARIILSTLSPARIVTCWWKWANLSPLKIERHELKTRGNDELLVKLSQRCLTIRNDAFEWFFLITKLKLIRLYSLKEKEKTLKLSIKNWKACYHPIAKLLEEISTIVTARYQRVMVKVPSNSSYRNILLH